MATRHVPPVAAKAGLVFFLAVNVLLQWVFDTGIHYLHLLAITFVITTVLMLIIGKIKPMAVPYQPAVIPVVSVEPWKNRHWYSAALLILMVLRIYHLFTTRTCKMNNALIWCRYLLSVTGMLCLLTPLHAQQAAHVKHISFGKNNYIAYDLQKGTYSVWTGGKEVIRNAFAFYEDASRPDTLPVSRTFTSARVKDKMGEGTRYVITSAGNGIKKQHFFYVYKEKDGFYTSLTLQGKRRTFPGDEPFNGEAAIYTSGVVVPFDNDAWIRYRVADQRGPAFTSSEVTALYDSVTNAGLILGSVEHNNWKTG